MVWSGVLAKNNRALGENGCRVGGRNLQNSINMVKTSNLPGKILTKEYTF